MSNVRDFGAAGDGKSLDTAAIQRALDAGGIVHFPPGVYLTGTIFLRSDGGLDLDEGAVLLGSTDPADYNRDDFDPRNAVFASERVSGAHLIIAMDCRNLTIRGKGEINGNGEAFFNKDKILNWGWHRPIFSFTDWRPGQMIYLCGCSEIRIHDVSLRNAAYWNCFLHDCENAEIHHLNIREDRRVTNTDGIDIDCCRHVLIHDCDINSGDDSIAIRANRKPFGGRMVICEDVTVRNCRLSSTASGIRVGVGDSLLRNCRFENIEIYDTHICIALCPSYSRGRCVQIEDIVFADCTARGHQALLLVPAWFGESACDYASLKPVRNVLFENFRGEGAQGSLLKGTGSESLFRNIRMKGASLKLLAPSEPPCSAYWKYDDYGILNVAEIPGFEVTDLTGESEENLPSVVLKNHS